MNMSGDKYMVYKHVSPSGKVYIGQTKFIDNPNKRWRSGSHYKQCPSFYRAIKKYGWENIKHYIIASDLTSQEADLLETIFIKIYKKCDICYNINDGGKGCPGFWNTEEGKEYIRSIPRGENHPNFGKHLSDETKRKLSIANKGNQHHKGYKHSKETIQKIKESNSRVVYQFTKEGVLLQEWASLHEVERVTGFYATNISKCLSQKTITAYGYVWSLSNVFPTLRERQSHTTHRSKESIEKWKVSMVGKFRKTGEFKHSEETRILMKINSPNKKAVLQFSLLGEFIKEWESVTEASKSVRTSKTQISRCCNGGTKMCHGFIWKWKELKQE